MHGVTVAAGTVVLGSLLKRFTHHACHLLCNDMRPLHDVVAHLVFLSILCGVTLLLNTPQGMLQNARWATTSCREQMSLHTSSQLQWAITAAEHHVPPYSLGYGASCGSSDILA
jgi:hypothetical protein